MKKLGNVTWTVDHSVFDSKMREFLAKTRNASKPFKRWALITGRAIEADWQKMTFSHLYSVSGFAGGKNFRGNISWRPVRPMYGRLTDGVSVPPWGGVTRIAAGFTIDASSVEKRRAIKVKATRVFGKVSGRKRPSGKRVKPNDVVGQDTRNMIKQFTRNPQLHANKRGISMVTNVKYAHHQNNLRQFNALTDGDKLRLVEELKLWFIESIDGFNKRKAARLAT